MAAPAPPPPVRPARPAYPRPSTPTQALLVARQLISTSSDAAAAPSAAPPPTATATSLVSGYPSSELSRSSSSADPSSLVALSSSAVASVTPSTSLLAPLSSPTASAVTPASSAQPSSVAPPATPSTDPASVPASMSSSSASSTPASSTTTVSPSSTQPSMSSTAPSSSITLPLPVSIAPASSSVTPSAPPSSSAPFVTPSSVVVSTPAPGVVSSAPIPVVVTTPIATPSYVAPVVSVPGTTQPVQPQPQVTTPAPVVVSSAASLVPVVVPSTSVPALSPLVVTSQSAAATALPGVPTAAPTDTLTSSTVTSVFTTTSNGQLVTITAIATVVVGGAAPSQSGASSSATGRGLNTPNSDASSSGFFANSGAVAGTFVVVGLVVAGAAVGLALWCFRRKRARRLDEDLRVAAGGAGDGGAGVDRFSGEDDYEHDPFQQATYLPPTEGDMRELPPSVMLAAGGAYLHPRHSGSDRHSSGDHSNTGSIGSNRQQMQQGYHPSTVDYYGQYPVERGDTAYGGMHEEFVGVARGHGSAENGEGEGSNGSSPREGRSDEGILESNGHADYSHVYGGQPTNRRESTESYYGNVQPFQSNSRRLTSSPPPITVTSSDQRLNPMMYSHNESGTSLGDDHDYSRRILRVANHSEV